MNITEFDSILEKRIEAMRTMLSSKGQEYANDADRLHNFNRAGDMLGITKEKALVGMMAKHWISVLDIVNDLDHGKLPSLERLEEKIGDSINYLVLLESALKDRLNIKTEDKTNSFIP